MPGSYRAYKRRVATVYITDRILIASTIIKAYNSYNSFAKRVVFLKNINIKNSELEYDLIVNKNNKNNNNLFAIIEEKINEKKEDYNILFKDNSKIEDNTLY